MSSRRPKLLPALLAALALLTLPPVAAHADGDPASDVLLGQNVFYPYSPPVTTALTKQLDAAAAAAAKGGFPVKVALIASPVDLGVIPDLFNKPQKYADFLDQEISFQTKQPLLVVMPAGLGGVALPAPAMNALTTLGKPSGTQSNDLARAALAAVIKLAAAAGHPLRGTGGASNQGSSSSTPILVALVLAALATIVVLLFTRRRRARAGV